MRAKKIKLNAKKFRWLLCLVDAQKIVHAAHPLSGLGESHVKVGYMYLSTLLAGWPG